MGRGCASRVPTLRRLSVRTPEMARALPDSLGPRPGTRYVEGVVDPLRRQVSPTPVALDPGGPLEHPQALGWVERATGEPLRVTTDPTVPGAVLLETLDARASRWSRPSPAQPIDSVRPHLLLIRRVGRASGVIDAEADGLHDLDRRRPVHEEADRLAYVQGEARRLGYRALPAGRDCLSRWQSGQRRRRRSPSATSMKRLGSYLGVGTALPVPSKGATSP